jgi:hypothetical protein
VAQINWTLAWIPLAASVLLTVALGIYAYRLGVGRGFETARLTTTPPAGESQAGSPAASLQALERQISDAGHERVVLQGQLAERDRVIKDLRSQVQAQTASLSDLRLSQARLADSLQRSEADKQQATAEEQKMAEQRKSLDLKLQAADSSLQKSLEELDSLRQQRSLDQSRSESLEAQIRDLHEQLHDREQAINKDEELLAHDKDIRDLMGARDLYIAKVYDVGRDGATQKPSKGQRVTLCGEGSYDCFGSGIERARLLPTKISMGLLGTLDLSRIEKGRQRRSLSVLHDDNSKQEESDSRR